MRLSPAHVLAFFALTVPPFLALSLYGARYDAPPRTITFLDRHGAFIGTVNPAYDGYQIWTPLRDIPPAIVAATLKREDRAFSLHPGVNPWSIAKAALANLRAGRVKRGGSTITQQLAKNLVQEREGKILTRSFASKLKTTLVALALELRHPKDWILERYLNSVYYGRRCYGVAAAARHNFDKDLSGLTADEIAKLSLLPRSPGQADRIIPKPIRATRKIYGRHFMEMAARAKRADAQNVIRTTLDLELQKRAEDGLAHVVAAREDADPVATAAAVIIEPESGDLLALVGSRGYFDARVSGEVNAALSLRQPGSTLKPFTYFAAFAKGMTPDTIVSDSPVNYSVVDSDDAYAPQNFDRLFHGTVTIREALANSYNVPAVEVLNRIGLSYYHDVLKGFGFTSLKAPPQHYGLAVTLGSGEVTLLELTNAFVALARGGFFKPVRMFETDPIRAGTEILPKSFVHAARITDILSDRNARLKTFGDNAFLAVDGFDVAVKTGTSHDLRDNWTVGYAPNAVVGVWVGHADGSPLKDTTGATGAAPVWHALMESSLRGKTPVTFGFRAKTAPRPPHARKNPMTGAAPRHWDISAPLNRSRYQVHPWLPRERQKIPAEVTLNGARPAWLDWFLDDAWIARSEIAANDKSARAWIEPKPGDHVLEIAASDGSKRKSLFHVDGKPD
jgi:penicillin-binding protein 1C